MALGTFSDRVGELAGVGDERRQFARGDAERGANIGWTASSRGASDEFVQHQPRPQVLEDENIFRPLAPDRSLSGDASATLCHPAPVARQQSDGVSQCRVSVGGETAGDGHRVAIGGRTAQPIDARVDRCRIHSPGGRRQFVLVVSSVAVVRQEGINGGLQWGVPCADRDVVESVIEGSRQRLVRRHEATERPDPLRKPGRIDVARPAHDAVGDTGRHTAGDQGRDPADLSARQPAH